YEILEIIEHESPKITAYDIEMMGEKTLAVNSSKIDTLRSTAYLLLYNLIESTIYNSITSIFDEIKDNRLKYFDLIEDLQKYWLNNLYKHDDKKRKETVIETIMKVANQIFNDTIELASNEINYGGSLDAQTIFATAKSMRINIGAIHRIFDKNKHGQTLIDIKQKRNWLAHGEKSFIEVGGSTTFNQLKDTKIYIYDFLNAYIEAAEDYITNKHYKISE
ncbi:MAG TPA: hypothetical protein DCP78_22385, partial [Sphingobacterium sp.]|nr:hypothetical protein [Sphingobacterium sp.]